MIANNIMNELWKNKLYSTVLLQLGLKPPIVSIVLLLLL